MSAVLLLRKSLAKAESGAKGLQNALATSNTRLVAKYQSELQTCADKLLEDSLEASQDESEVVKKLVVEAQQLQARALDLIFKADEHISSKEEQDNASSKKKVKELLLKELEDELSCFVQTLKESPSDVLEDTNPTNSNSFLSDISSRRQKFFSSLKSRKVKLFEEYQVSDAEVSNLGLLFQEADAKLESWLNQAAALNNIENKPKPDPKPHTPEIKIDRLALPIFDGSARNFSRFINAFNSTVAVAYQDSAVKLLYLKGQCLKNEPKELIKSVSDFDSAISRLRERYGRSELVIAEVLKEIDNLKLDTNESKAVVKLSSTLESIVDDTKAVGAFDDLCNIVTLGSIEARLPERVLVKWVETKLPLADSTTKHKVSKLLDFLKQEAKLAETLLAVNTKTKTPFDSKTKPKHFNGNVQKKTDDPKECFRCGGSNHTAITCRVPREVICRFCRGRGHIEKACFKKKGLSKPEGATSSENTNKDSKPKLDQENRHVKFAPDDKTSGSVPVVKSVNANMSNVGVRLPFDVCNTEVGPMNVLWDSGSMLNFVDSDFAESKSLKGTKVDLSYRLVNGEICHSTTKVYQIMLVSKAGKRKHIQAYGITPIMQDIPKIDLDHLASKYKVIAAKVSKIAVPEGDVHLLIGADAIADFPTTAWSKNSIVLMNSNYSSHDFLICGSDAIFSHSASVGHVAAISVKHATADPICDSIVGHVESIRKQAILKDFWSVEDLGVKPPTLCKACLNCHNCNSNTVRLSENDARDYEVVRKNLCYNPNDHCWEAKYPFIADPVGLRDNYDDALKALIHCEAKLSKDDKLKHLYSQQVNDFKSRGVIRKLSDDEIQSWDGPTRYISHHEVHKANSTTPLRLVVNSSFKKANEKSLNDILLKGPNVLSDIFSVLLRWRFFNVAFIGDISKMYHNIRTGDLEGNLRRMLWRDFETGRSPDIYVFQRVTFGDRPAGCLAVIALQQTADMFSDISPKAARVLKHDSYMDDIVSGSDSVKGARELISDIKHIASQGGFHFKEFVVSGDPIQAKGSLEDHIEHVLGLLWSPSDDKLMFNVTINPNKKVKGERKPQDKSLKDINLTKRICLRMINSLFDPFGILAPLTVLLKIKMKEYFVKQENDFKWDSSLSEAIQDDFKKIFFDLMSLSNFKLPRSVTTSAVLSATPTLICFTDASMQAFCAVVYVRFPVDDHEFQVRLLTAKTRVSPIKQESIPRLELLGVLLGVRLIVKVKQALRMELNDVLLLTDSKCVLGMVHNSKAPLNGFVGSRIHEIRAHLSEINFAWVSSQNNIADLGSRGGNLKSFSDDSEWLIGPSWLRLSKENWPIEYSPKDIESEMDASVFAIVSCDPQPLINIKRFSDLNRLLRVTAFCFLFIRSKGNRKNTIDADCTKVFLNPELLNAAESYWVRIVSLKVVQCIDKLTALRPKIVYDDVGNVQYVVTSGRLGNMMRIGYDRSELIILDARHPFSRLLLKNFHDEKHGSDDYVLWRSRSKYWIPYARRIIRSIRSECYFCRLLNKKCESQLMSLLPDARLLPSPPFASVALDLFGPLHYSDPIKKRLTNKCWGVVITCMASRAVYLDVSPSYDTDSFLQVLKRFFSIRGVPTKIVSDQGSQLIAASNEVRGMLELLDWSRVKGWTARHYVEWQFVPVKGQHANGCAEAIVKSSKRLLTIVLQSKRVSFTELQTVLFEVAQILNCRPLGLYHKPGTDPLDGGPITPNHLLLGRATNMTPFLKYEQNVSLTKRIRFLNTIVEEFWNKFKVVVYPSLMPTYKWKREKRLAKVGDIVLLDIDDGKVGHYTLGKVVGIKSNKDNLPRTLTLEYVTSNSQGDITRKTTSRSVHSCVLIVPIEEQSDS